MGEMDIASLQPAEVRRKMAAGETFVLNVITDWCPDCTERQHPNLPVFIRAMGQEGVVVYQLTVQAQRLVFLSNTHEQLVEQFGGHGYPRTILIKNGKEEESAVEVMSEQGLLNLARRFTDILQTGV